MATIYQTIVIAQDELTANVQRDLYAETGLTELAGLKLQDYIKKCVFGSHPAVIQTQINAVKASGTLTGDTVIVTDAIAINGTSFACVASGASGNQFNIGSDDTETMANLAAAINASSDMTGIATATSDATVCTVSAAVPGAIGNAITLTSADATIVASGSGKLTGGTNGDTSTTHYFGSAS
jgi:phage tail sheath gpL-like